MSADKGGRMPADEPMINPEEAQEEEEEEEEEEYASISGQSSTQTSTLTWITWFTSLPGHDYYCEVLEDYIEDDFNLTGLQAQVPFWKEALEMVLDVEPEEDSLTIPDVSIIESSAELLYGLVHQRFILTKVGLQQMVEKYETCAFGACPRFYCHQTPVLPCGRSDTPGIDTVKLFCPNCGDIYGPPSSKYANVDGAFFGMTFPTLFFDTYPEFLAMPFCPPIPPVPARVDTPSSTHTGTGSASTGTGTGNASGSGGNEDASRWPAPYTSPNEHGGQRIPLAEVYEPRIYGFRVSERARSGPRMAWLRERPTAYDELDNVDWKGRWVGDGGSGGRGGADADADQPGPSGSGGSKLFDDDDDEKDDDESEEEEEDGGGGGAGGAVKQAAPAPTTKAARQPQQSYNLASGRSEPLPNLSSLLQPVPTTARHFLPTAPSRRSASLSKRNQRRLQALAGPLVSETETESELETPAEEQHKPAVAWADRRKRVVVERRLGGKVALDSFARLDEVEETNAGAQVIEI